MNKTIKYLILAQSTLFAQAVYSYPLPASPVKSYECSQCNALPKDYLHNDWPITAKDLEHTLSKPNSNFTYRMQVKAKDLERGITLRASPGALIEVHSEGKTLPNLELSVNGGKTIPLQSATRNLRGSNSNHASLFLPQGVKADHLKLRATSMPPQSVYTVQVTDKVANIYLSVQTDKLEYVYGEFLTTTIKFNEASSDFPAETLDAQLVSPEGKTVPLTLNRVKRNTFQGRSQLLEESASRGLNWKVKVVAYGLGDSEGTTRNSHASFSLAIPSATLNRIEKISDSPLTFRVYANVATPSRYALKAVLFKKNEAGMKVPFHYAEAAQWLPQGEQTLDIPFTNIAPGLNDLSIGNIHLMDYYQFKNVYHYDKTIPLSKIE